MRTCLDTHMRVFAPVAPSACFLHHTPLLDYRTQVFFNLVGPASLAWGLIVHDLNKYLINEQSHFCSLILQTALWAGLIPSLFLDPYRFLQNTSLIPVLGESWLLKSSMFHPAWNYPLLLFHLKPKQNISGLSSSPTMVLCHSPMVAVTYGHSYKIWE